MLRVGRWGHHVLYVETGYFLLRHVWALVRGEERRSLGSRLLSGEAVTSGVRVRKALNVLPWRVKFRLPNSVNCAVTSWLVRRLAARLPQPVVLWIYDPGSAPLAGACGEVFAVYDCVDDYVEQTTSRRGRAMIVGYDRMAALRSRLVFATSTTMYERQRQLNKRTYLVPNAGDYEHFARAADPSIVAPDAADLARPVLGFAGNFLSAKVDFGLLEHVADARPEWTLLLIGPARQDTVSSLERLASHPNVRWLGPRPYADLPGYVAAFDVGLIPYVANDYTRSCFPLKLYEYLAAGKPVVASGLPELAGMGPDVTLVEERAAFVDAVEAALARRGDADRARRMRLAARNSWETRTERLLELIRHELRAPA
jgi:glycosyltransferase involved in cell wall biosynthesis